jgi:hypothetical protein
MAQHCFRNTELENLHAADKIDDEDMKALMTDVVDCGAQPGKRG